MYLLLRLTNVLVSAFSACDTIDHVCSFAGNGVSDGESFVGGSDGDCITKRSKFASFTPFIPTFMEAICIGCGFILGMTEFVMDHFAFSIFEKASTLLTLVVGCVNVGCWWLWINLCVGGQSSANQKVIQISTPVVRHDRRFWVKHVYTVIE